MDNAKFAPLRRAALWLKAIFAAFQRSFAGSKKATEVFEMPAEWMVAAVRPNQSVSNTNTPTSRQGSAAQPQTPAPKQRRYSGPIQAPAAPPTAPVNVTERICESLDQVDSALASIEASHCHARPSESESAGETSA